jgi:hypothetical protein
MPEIACSPLASSWHATKPNGIILSSLSSVLIVDVLVESPLAGAERATGSVAIIDVFRAFTAAAVALANGASQSVYGGRSRVESQTRSI